MAIFIEHSGWVIWPSAHSQIYRSPLWGGLAWFTMHPPFPPPPPLAPTPPLLLPSDTSRHTILPSARCLTRFHSAALSPALLSKYASSALSAPLKSAYRGKASWEADRLALAWPCLSAADWCVTLTCLWLKKMKFCLSVRVAGERVIWGGGNRVAKEGGGE